MLNKPRIIYKVSTIVVKFRQIWSHSSSAANTYTLRLLGGSPSLVNKGLDSWLKCHEIESPGYQVDILSFICCKIWTVWKERKWMKKRPERVHIYKNYFLGTPVTEPVKHSPLHLFTSRNPLLAHDNRVAWTNN